MSQDWHERITIDSAIHHGDPCIKSTRIPVTMIIGSLAENMSIPDILEQYPQLTIEDIQASLAYASTVL